VHGGYTILVGLDLWRGVSCWGDGRRGVNCTAYLLWHLDDEVEEKSCKAELHPRQSVDRTQSVCVGATTYSEEMQGFVIDG
jgi:hypothetical protein